MISLILTIYLNNIFNKSILLIYLISYSIFISIIIFNKFIINFNNINCIFILVIFSSYFVSLINEPLKFRKQSYKSYLY